MGIFSNYFLYVCFCSSPRPLSETAETADAVPGDITYTVERHVSTETASRSGGRVNVSVNERRFRGSLESIGSTSTPKPLVSEEEFVNSLRSLGSTSTPFVTASSSGSSGGGYSLGAVPRVPLLPVLPEKSSVSENESFGTPYSSPENSRKAARKIARAKRRINFTGVNPKGSKFVYFSRITVEFLKYKYYY